MTGAYTTDAAPAGFATDHSPSDPSTVAAWLQEAQQVRTEVLLNLVQGREFERDLVTRIYMTLDDAVNTARQLLEENRRLREDCHLGLEQGFSDWASEQE